MEKLLKWIVFTTVIIILLIIILLTCIQIKNNSNSNNSSGLIDEDGNYEDAVDNINYNNAEIEDVTNKIEYYTVRNCINTYLEVTNKNRLGYYVDDKYNQNSQKEVILKILSSEYVSKKNINLDNVLDYIDVIDERQIFLPLNMKVLKKENISKYLAYGIIQTSNNKYVDELYIFVNLDVNNKTYSIELIDGVYNNINDINYTNQDISIDSNIYNKYKNQTVNKEYLMNEYLVLFKRLMLVKSDVAYDYMSEEYKNARFGNLENFEKYIDNNRKELSVISLKEYSMNNYDNYTEYVCKDQYDNLYIFKETSTMQYTVMLDTYTIPTTKFKETYNSATDEEKVQMNIDKFIQMINRHDYKTSYNCISEGFKNNYFNTQEQFENYIKNTFFTYNNFEFKNITKKGSNIYTCDLNISDLTGEKAETRNITIIMKLNDNLDFEMSFSM